MNNTAPPDAILGLAVALGIGLLVGVERERRKGAGDHRAAAGLRTFAIAAMAGAMAQLVHAPGLVPIGAGLVALLAAVSHWKSRSNDPGITTEIALFATYSIGVLSISSPSLAAACGTGLALLLAARNRLHHFATQLLSEQELHDGVLLAALALIVLPLIPSAPIEVLGGINPRPHSHCCPQLPRARRLQQSLGCCPFFSARRPCRPRHRSPPEAPFVRAKRL